MYIYYHICRMRNVSNRKTTFCDLHLHRLQMFNEGTVSTPAEQLCL